MIRVDTNYIIRYLINDDEKMASIAEKAINSEEIFISNEVIAEVVYVLLGVYKITKRDIANKLQELIDFENISVSNYKVIIKSLELFRDKKLDFVDCLLCAYSPQDKILTFDKKLQSCVNSQT